MTTEEIISNVRSIDWDKYNGPEFYKSEDITEALICLANLNSSEQAEEIGHEVTYSIGNEHAGTYYPAVLSALDIIIAIEKYSENKARQICAEAILNNIYYFEPELGMYSGCTDDELKAFVINKLEPYADDE